MASRTADITLGDTTYKIHRFNMLELQEVAEFITGTNPLKAAFDVVKLALRRAVPPVSPAEFDMLEADMDEVKDAMEAALILSGVKKAGDENPPKDPPNAT